MNLLLSRRRLLGGVASVVAAPALLTPALAQARRLPTPAQTEGPFYPLDLLDDTDFDLLRNGTATYAQGTPAWVEGVVTDTAGVPVRGAQVEIWQCDHQGHYHHPGDGGRADQAFQGFGRVAVDAQGAYRFRTMRPVAYSSRTPHIHVKVKLGERAVLTTQLYVQGDPGNERDFLWRRLRSDAERAALTVPFVPGADGQHARFPIVLAL
ncbi:intradiol ring-cleavage dioxygenase [Hydrogenophaga defluvii]|uniref:Intradiol ring-cleavage dioxygenase n=1 Tax=Hydrogenophaga defluvii TaxID=249410 RepID=A0ABW2SDF2_9BURK